MKLPDIPKSWLIAMFFIGMLILRAFGIDSYVSIGMTAVAAYLFGVKSEQTRKEITQTPS